jgi:uncharacterized phage protein gp47/JayE
MADHLTLIRQDFETRLIALGVDLPDWDRDTFLGPLTATMAARLDAISENVIQIDAGYSPHNAAGLQLENIAAMVGVVRREATRSTVTLQISANNGTVVQIGSLVEDTEKQRWRTTEDLVFASTTTQDVVAEAVDLGDVVATANTITKIVSATNGWTAVDNAAAATTGRPRETDGELRKRRLLSLQRGTQATVAGIRAAVFDLDWTTATTVVDNPSMSSAVVEGLTLPPKSFAVVVYPDTPTADQIDELVETLAGVVPAGIEQYGDESDEYTYDDGHTATFTWSYADQTAVDVTVTAAALSDYSTAEVEAGIEAIIEDYFLSLGVGDDVTAIAISALVATVEGLDSADVTVGAGAQKVTLTAVEIAISGTVSVTVT